MRSPIIGMSYQLIYEPTGLRQKYDKRCLLIQSYNAFGQSVINGCRGDYSINMNQEKCQLSS